MNTNILMPDRNGRKSESEIINDVSQKYGLLVINGVYEVSENSKALKYTGPISTWRKFVQDSGHYAYLAHQCDKDFLEWQTFPVAKNIKNKYVLFLISFGMGNGSALPQPSGQFDIYLNNKKLISFNMSKHSELWNNNRENISLYYEVKRLDASSPNMALTLDEMIKEESFASFGILALKIPMAKLLPGRRQRLRIVPVYRDRSNQWIRIEECKSKVTQKDNLLIETDFSESLNILTFGKERRKSLGYNVYFGDIHVHSGRGRDGRIGKGCGEGSLDDNYQYARDISNLDIFSLTDHDWQLTENEWQFRNEKVDQYYEEGKFVTIPAFEWTSRIYGHRNIYYYDNNQPFFNSRNKGDQWDINNDSPEKLWQHLDTVNSKAIIIPHHFSSTTHPGVLDYYNPKYERLVEVYSVWGNSEYYGAPFIGRGTDHYKGLFVRDMLNRGWRVGIIASSDGHDGNAGNAQWTKKDSHMAHFLGSGRIAILSAELTRNDIFEAMYNRRVYGTTGEQIILEFSINGNPMGSELKKKIIKDPPVIFCRARGTCPISKISIIKNGEVLLLKNFNCESMEETLDYVDNDYVRFESIYYYVRVQQKDNEIAWSSPIWIE